MSEVNATVLLLVGLAACLPLPAETPACDDDDCDCPIYYWDLDGDGYGDDALAEAVCGEPLPGMVRNGDDCYDGNADARPGQERVFAVHRGDGSYDYDCEGNPRGNLWPTTRAVCKGDIDCEDPSVNHPGWIGTPPGCGESGPWLDQCEYHFFGMPRCKPEVLRDHRATCR